MGTLSHIGDLQRDIMVSRKKKFDEENKVNYDKQRRRREWTRSEATS
jgi:hypothetical protein